MKKKLYITIMSVVLTFSMLSLGASAAWSEQPVEGRVYFGQVGSSTLTQMPSGYHSYLYRGSTYNLYFLAQTDFKLNHTYEITFDFTFYFDSDSTTYPSFSLSTMSCWVTDNIYTSIPSNPLQVNSSGTPYVDLFTQNKTSMGLVTSAGSGVSSVESLTFAFSTASGYFDNLEGTKCITFLASHNCNVTQKLYVSDISIKCVSDPTAEYYQQLVIENMDRVGDDLEDIGGQASEHENWALDKAADLREQATEQMSLNLDLTKSLLSTSTFASSGSIGSSALGVISIYNLITSALPPELQALLVAIPTLSFIGWVIGRVQ